MGAIRIVKEEHMIRRCIRRLGAAGAVAVIACLVLAIGAEAKAKPKTLTVCKHGCRYTTIQGAVNASGRNATIKVKPGKYVEGVIVQGHRHDGLRIIGASKNAAKVLIEGKHAKGPGGAAPRTASRATTSTAWSWRT
jgi:pectin methylesterase-like acyl-CoA thioesterase